MSDRSPQDGSPQDRDDATSQAQGRRPSDTEQLVGDTALSEPITDSPRVQPAEVTERQADGQQREPAPPEPPRSGGTVPTGEDAEREAELGHS